MNFVWPLAEPPDLDAIPAGYLYGAQRSDHIHQGLDMGDVAGQIVVAAARGTVFQAYTYNAYGGPGIVDIDHGESSGATWRTRYLHVDPASFSSYGTVKGTPVEAGQPIATTAPISGPHLHFEVRRCVGTCSIWYSGWEHLDPLEVLPEPGLAGAGKVLVVAAVAALAIFYFFMRR